MAKKKRLHDLILGALKASPDGLSIHELRAKLPEDIGPQAELNKRVRELRYKHDIPHESGRYVYRGARVVPLDNQGISSKLRAAVLNKANGRCQMCGRTVKDDGIKLEADHKIPHNWGGATDLDNLWAICQLCNSGKRDFFKSFDDDEMRDLVGFESVHERLAKALQKRGSEGVPSWFLEFVANVNDFQEDWHRRLRELRVIGIEYVFAKKRLPSGKVETTYFLKKWKDPPANATAVIRARERAKRQ